MTQTNLPSTFTPDTWVWFKGDGLMKASALSGEYQVNEAGLRDEELGSIWWGTRVGFWWNQQVSEGERLGFAHIEDIQQFQAAAEDYYEMYCWEEWAGQLIYEE